MILNVLMKAGVMVSTQEEMFSVLSENICSEDSTIPSSALAISPEIHLEQ